MQSVFPSEANRASFYGGYLQGKDYWKKIIKADKNDPMEFVAKDDLPDNVLLVKIPKYGHMKLRIDANQFLVVKFPGLKDSNDKAFFNSESEHELQLLGWTDPAEEDNGKSYYQYAVFWVDGELDGFSLPYWYSASKSCEGSAQTKDKCNLGKFTISIGEKAEAAGFLRNLLAMPFFLLGGFIVEIFSRGTFWGWFGIDRCLFSACN